MKKQKFFMILLTIIFSAISCNIGSDLPNEPIKGENKISPTAVSSPSPQSPTDKSTNITDTPTIPNEGFEEVYIQSPGALSEILSPINLSGYADASFEQNLVIKLTDITAAVLAEQTTIINADIGIGGPFQADILFSVTETTRARLSVYHSSPRDGGLIHLNSIPITLLANGSKMINISPPSSETILINSPSSNQEISGGLLSFSGVSEYFFESNLGITLCGEGGSGSIDEICGTEDNILLETYTMIGSPDIGQPGPFNGSIPYAVSEPTHARLVVYARSPMDGGIEHLSSVDILLYP